MGCDIHLFTEVKINGVWHLHTAPAISRHYSMFSKMVGVRRRENETPIQQNPKGLPDDLSTVVALYAQKWDRDMHSASWFNVEEIAQLETWLEADAKANRPKEFFYPEKLWGYLFGGSYGGFKKYRTDYTKEIEDVRFVFWFDN